MVLNGDVLARIYLGSITRWDDPAIRALNPQLSLPPLTILVVHRADGSGTTFNFTAYLARVSGEWRRNVGADTAVEWPLGVGGEGNAGVAAEVAQAAGAIGYVEYAYAVQSKLAWTDMVNGAGRRVRPEPASFEAATADMEFSEAEDFLATRTDHSAAQSWPLTAPTYMLLRADHPPARNKAVLTFLDWALHQGRSRTDAGLCCRCRTRWCKQIEASWAKTLKVTP